MITKSPLGVGLGKAWTLAQASEDKPFVPPKIPSYDTPEKIELCLNCKKPDCVSRCPYGVNVNVPKEKKELKKKSLQARARQQRNMEIYGPVQSKIREARLARGWSLAEFGRIVGMDSSILSHWEHGRSKAKWERIIPYLPELKEVAESEHYL